MSMTPEDIEKLKPTIYKREEHPISRGDIDPDALKIMYRLSRHGFKAYLVGGGVRDLFLKKPPKDFDISTDATPRKIKSLFRNSRLIGRRFKLVHIYFKAGKLIELATFRAATDEVEDEDNLLITTDNTYGSEVTDALRRDITINGLFYDLTTFSIIDYVGGVKDLRKKVIRVIGDPNVRYAEDPVRMLRVVRHAARAEFRIDTTSWKGILNNHELILQCPQVRIYQEVLKDMSSGCFLEILQLLSGSHMLQHFLPELTEGTFPRLTADNDFTRGIQRADEEVRDGNSPSPTVFLCLLAIFRGGRGNTYEDFFERFQGVEELVTFVSSSFSQLAVPRKERERILDTLTLWFKLAQQPISRIKVATLARRLCIDDLDMLLKVLDDDSEFAELVTSAVRTRRRMSRKQKQEGNPRRGGRNRNQGRRRSDKERPKK